MHVKCQRLSQPTQLMPGKFFGVTFLLHLLQAVFDISEELQKLIAPAKNSLVDLFEREKRSNEGVKSHYVHPLRNVQNLKCGIFHELRVTRVTNTIKLKTGHLSKGF